MQTDDFMNKLNGMFKRDEFSDVNESDIREWIDENHISEMHLNVILKKIKMYYKYRTYPRLSNIVEIWEKYNKKDEGFSNSPFRDQTLEKYAHTGIDKIVSMIRDIKFRDGHVSNEEMDFLARYDVLLYIHDLLLTTDMNDEERGAYIRQCKESIQRGEKICLIAFERFRKGAMAS